MDMKQEQVVVEWPGRAAGPRRGAVAERPAVKDAKREAGREAVFDIADFEALAVFAGLRLPAGNQS